MPPPFPGRMIDRELVDVIAKVNLALASQNQQRFVL